MGSMLVVGRVVTDTVQGVTVEQATATPAEELIEDFEILPSPPKPDLSEWNVITEAYERTVEDQGYSLTHRARSW